jgi:hypothetical protein
MAEMFDDDGMFLALTVTHGQTLWHLKKLIEVVWHSASRSSGYVGCSTGAFLASFFVGTGHKRKSTGAMKSV